MLSGSTANSYPSFFIISCFMMDCKSGTATGKGLRTKSRKEMQNPHSARSPTTKTNRNGGGMEVEVAVAERKTSGTRALHSKKKPHNQTRTKHRAMAKRNGDKKNPEFASV